MTRTIALTWVSGVTFGAAVITAYALLFYQPPAPCKPCPFTTITKAQP